MERETKGLRRCNDEMESTVRGLGREWGRAMGKLNSGLGMDKERREGVEGDEFDAFDLGGIERELDVLEEWVTIVEEEDGEQGSGSGQGKKSQEEGGEGGAGKGTSGLK